MPGSRFDPTQNDKEIPFDGYKNHQEPYYNLRNSEKNPDDFEYGLGSQSERVGQYYEEAKPRSHVGKGPKGFKRSDDRLKEEACEILFHHEDIDASDIEVTVENGETRLSGFVPSRQMKFMAEEALIRLYGVTDIDNQLRVR